MNTVRWRLASAVALLLVATDVMAQSNEGGAMIRCYEPKPFREVAQDEIRTIVELCDVNTKPNASTSSARSGVRHQRTVNTKGHVPGLAVVLSYPNR